MMIVKGIVTMAAMAATLTLANATPALAGPGSGNGADGRCSDIFGDPSLTGTVVSTPNGYYNLNCGYPGPAPGSGAVIFQCSYYFDATGKLVAPPSGSPDFGKEHCNFPTS